MLSSTGLTSRSRTSLQSSTHSSQMPTEGVATILATSFLDLPQKEQESASRAGCVVSWPRRAASSVINVQPNV